MLETFNIYFVRRGNSLIVSEVGATRAGRRVTLLLMEGAEITGVINAKDDE